MKYIANENHQKYILATFILALLLLSNVFLNYNPFSLAIRNILGCSELSQTADKICFIVFSLLVQNHNANTISYYINNIDYLSVRRGSKHAVAKKLIKQISFSNFHLIICFIIVIICLGIFTNEIFSFELSYIVNVFFQGYFKCIIISLLQIILSLRINNDKVFGIILFLSLLYTFIIQILFPILDNVSILNNFIQLTSIIHIIFLIFLYIVLKKNFSKEWSKYAN